MNTKIIIAPLESKKRTLLNKRELFLKQINSEILLAENDIRSAVKELEGINDGYHTWVKRDVFTTTFWGVQEVCLIRYIKDGYIKFERLESIRGLQTLKKDFCAAEMEIELFLKMNKTFIHHSEWYSESVE